jgi:hypothetical protein
MSENLSHVEKQHIQEVFSFMFDVCKKQEFVLNELDLYKCYVSLFNPVQLTQKGFSVVYLSFIEAIQELSKKGEFKNVM